MSQFLTPWRLRVYPRLLVFPLFLPLIVSLSIGDDAMSLRGPIGGDFAAFYAGGSLVADGSPEAIYDSEAVTAVQAPLFDESHVPNLPFLYPPFVASAMAPLALLPYRVALTIFTMLMFAAVAGSVQFLRPLLPRVDRHVVEATLLALALYPLFRSISGGQTTALVLLGLSAIFWALDRDHVVTAGMVAGLLLFKPQFAIPVIGLLAVRYPRALIGTALSGCVLWAWGAAILGWDWIGTWYGAASAQSEELIPFVPMWDVNIIGMAKEILGHDSSTAVIVGGLLVAVMTLYLIWVWRQPPVSLGLKMAACVCGMLLIPIHVLWYETGLLVLPFAVLADRLGRSSFNGLTGLMTLCLTAFVLPLHSGVVLMTATILTAAWVAREIRTDLESSRMASPVGGVVDAGRP